MSLSLNIVRYSYIYFAKLPPTGRKTGSGFLTPLFTDASPVFLFF